MLRYPHSRRTFLRGVGVTMALPWLESAPVWGDDKPKHACVRAAGAVRVPVRRQRLPQQGVVGQGRRQGHGARQGAGAAPARSARRCSSSAASTTQEALIGGIHSCQTGNLLTGAHLAPGGEIKIRDQLRPGPRREDARARRRCRASCSAASRRSRRSTRTTR